MKRAFDKSELTALGRRVEAPKDVDASVLEFVRIPPIAKVTFDCNEFTSLCPVTGQPDYATLKISLLYNDPRLLENKPPTLTIETKSLKLFLEGFRNKGMFQEDICHRIAEVIRQRYYDAACALAECALHPSLVTVRVEMFFNSRGGIAINPVCEL